MLDTVEINHVQHISFAQSRLTDAVSVILSELLSYEHPSKAVPLLCCLGRIRRTMQQGRGENAVYRYRIFPVGNREGAAAKP